MKDALNKPGSESGVRCLWMRGGSSKGGYFLADDLPSDPNARDAFLQRIMGSPHALQIDGMGGGNPLTSKVAVVKKSKRPGVDIDYLFLQVAVDEALVSDAQNCGNILAGVGPFAIERGLVAPQEGETPVRIFMENSSQQATAIVPTPNARVTYQGEAAIAGVPGTAAPIPITFRDTAGSMCGALLPTGNPIDIIDGLVVTLIDNGMPLVLIKAADLGVSGTEDCANLEANTGLKERLEALRLKVGPMMNLGDASGDVSGDVSGATVPKMTLLSPGRDGGVISTRSFIPHRCHASIGVFAAVTVATACAMAETVAGKIANAALTDGLQNLSVEHPSGETTCALVIKDGSVEEAGVVRTARKLFDGVVF